MKKRVILVLSILLCATFLIILFNQLLLKNDSEEINIVGTYQISSKTTTTVTISVNDNKNISYKEGSIAHKDGSSGINAQITNIYDNLYIIVNEDGNKKLDYDLILFKDDYLILINKDNTNYIEFKKVDELPTYF